MKQTTRDASKHQTTQFKGQRPPLRKRLFSFANYKKRHAEKTPGAAAQDRVEAAPGRPRGSWQDDIEGLVPMTVLESTTPDRTAMRTEQNLRFCATVIGVFLLLFGLVAVITALARDGAFPFIRASSREASSTPVTAHSLSTVRRPRGAVVSELPDESARGKQVTADDDDATIDGDANIGNDETRPLQTQSPKEASANCTVETALVS